MKVKQYLIALFFGLSMLFALSLSAQKIISTNTIYDYLMDADVRGMVAKTSTPNLMLYVENYEEIGVWNLDKEENNQAYPTISTTDKQEICAVFPEQDSTIIKYAVSRIDKPFLEYQSLRKNTLETVELKKPKYEVYYKNYDFFYCNQKPYFARLEAKGIITVFNYLDGTLIGKIKISTKELQLVLFSPNGEYLVAINNKNIILYKINPTEIVVHRKYPTEELLNTSVNYLKGNFNRAGDKLLLVKSSPDTKAYIFSFPEMRLEYTSPVIGNVEADAVSFSPDEKKILLADSYIKKGDGVSLCQYDMSTEEIKCYDFFDENIAGFYPLDIHPTYLIAFTRQSFLAIDPNQPFVPKKITVKEDEELAGITNNAAINEIGAAQQQAELYFSQKKFTEAIPVLKTLLQANPDDYMANVMSAYSFLMLKDFEGAKAYCDKSESLQNNDIMGSTLQMYLQIGLNKETRAKEYLQEIIARYGLKETLEFEDFPDLIAKGYDENIINNLKNNLHEIYGIALEARNKNLEALQSLSKNNSDYLSKLQQILTTERGFKIPRYVVQGVALANMAGWYDDQGDYTKAVPLYQEAISALEKYQDQKLLCQTHNNFGWSYLKLHKYDEAIQQLKAAVAIGEHEHLQAELAKAYTRLGNAYSDIKEAKTALNYLVKAHKIAAATNDKQGVATISNNLGTVLADMGNYTESIQYFEDALKYFTLVNDAFSEAMALGNIGEILLRSGDANSGLNFMLQSYELFTSIQENEEMGRTAVQLGQLYCIQGKYDEALRYFKKGEAHYAADKLPVALLSGLGNVSLIKGNYEEAQQYANKAIGVLQKQMADASDHVKRGVISAQNDAYRLKEVAAFRSGDFKNTFQIREEARAQVLKEKMNINNSKPLSPSDVATIIGDEAALIDYSLLYRPEYYQNTFFFPLTITKQEVNGLEINDQGIKSFVKQHFEARLKQIQLLAANAEGLKSYGDARGGYSTKDPDVALTTEMEYIVELYRDFLKNNNEETEVFRTDLANILYKILIKPLEPFIGNKKQLYIIPDGILAFIPFETLLNDEGKYLAEVYDIQYVQSATILKKLQERKYANTRKPLAAFGYPVYENVPTEESEAYRRLDAIGLKAYYDFVEEKGSSMRPAYIQMGITSWTKLPGTLAEVKRIGEIVNGAEIYTEDKASEDFFKALNQQNALANYKVLHFATHGFTLAAIPGMSAIILSQYATPKKEDGYLRVSEIEKLHIQADFVALSACQTGLGRIFKGEGVLGLTQAFLIAGANGITSSLWSVSDEGTAKFMSEVYERVYNKGETYAQAIVHTKRNFISGTYGARFAHPSIWAPFVYYGK